MFHSKLCFDCLNSSSVSHNARNWKNRKECKVCKKRYPTPLHGYEKRKNKVKQLDESKVIVDCATTNTKFDVMSMCVVPILVRYKLFDCIVETYAILDSYSQATFMQNKPSGALGLH